MQTLLVSANVGFVNVKCARWPLGGRPTFFLEARFAPAPAVQRIMDKGGGVTLLSGSSAEMLTISELSPFANSGERLAEIPQASLQCLLASRKSQKAALRAHHTAKTEVPECSILACSDTQTMDVELSLFLLGISVQQGFSVRRRVTRY